MSPSKATLEQKLFNIIPNNTINCIGWDVDVDEEGQMFMETCRCDECKSVYVAEAVTEREMDTDLLIDSEVKELRLKTNHEGAI